MPSWVSEGYQEYAKRLPRECRLQLLEVPLSKRHKSMTAAQAKQQEGKAMLAALPKDCTVIALDVAGKSWGTEDLARNLDLLGVQRPCAHATHQERVAKLIFAAL